MNKYQNNYDSFIRLSYSHTLYKTCSVQFNRLAKLHDCKVQIGVRYLAQGCRHWDSKPEPLSMESNTQTTAKYSSAP